MHDIGFNHFFSLLPDEVNYFLAELFFMQSVVCMVKQFRSRNPFFFSMQLPDEITSFHQRLVFMQLSEEAISLLHMTCFVCSCLTQLPQFSSDLFCMQLPAWQNYLNSAVTYFVCSCLTKLPQFSSDLFCMQMPEQNYLNSAVTYFLCSWPDETIS